MDQRGRPAPPAGVAFGVGVGSRAPTGPAVPGVQRDDVVGRVRDRDVVRRAVARVTDALVHLEELAAARGEARCVVEGLDEEIEAAVAHLRVDGASWAQAGRALGISRQGARQRFGDAAGANETRQDPGDPQGFGR